MVQCLNGLRHDAVICCDHKDRDVGNLRTTSTHGGERLVTGGVNEGDETVDAFVVGVNLVCTDVLGDSTSFARNDVGLADGIEQTSLTVVNVTHHGDDRRTNLEIFIGFIFELLVEVDVERVEKFAVFFFRGNDLNLEAELFTEDLERGLIDGLSSRCHFTKVEQNGDQVTGGCIDLVCEVRNRRTATKQDDSVAITTRNAYATKRRCLAEFKLCSFRSLRLTCLGLSAATTECTSGSTAGTTATTATATCGGTVRTKTGTRGGTSTSACSCSTSSTGTETATGTTSGTLESSTCTAGTTGTAGTTSATCSTRSRHA